MNAPLAVELAVSVGAAVAVALGLAATQWREARNDVFVARMNLARWWRRMVAEHRADKARPDVGLSILSVPSIQSHRLPRRQPAPFYRLCATSRDTTARLAALAKAEALRELAVLTRQGNR